MKDFNITNYVPIVLTAAEQKRYYQILDKVPAANRVYIQYAMRKQYKKIKSEYEKWLEVNVKTEEEMELPEITVKMPRDEGETNIAPDEW